MTKKGGKDWLLNRKTGETGRGGEKMLWGVGSGRGSHDYPIEALVGSGGLI